MTKRHVSLPDEAEAGVSEFIQDVDRRLTEAEREGGVCDVVQNVLIDLFGDREAYERWQAGSEVSPAERVRLQGYDPCNATVESEYYAEVATEEERFERSKYLQWLWRQFDATAMADNVEFALRFRRMLADHLFADVGENCRFFKGITFTYGHNISVGDNVVEADARVTYDAMVRAGCRIGENAVVGARAVVQSDVPAHHIAVGMPAKSVKIKPGFEDEAVPIEEANERRQDDREIPYDLPADLDRFDEFQRPPEYSEPAQPHRRP